MRRTSCISTNRTQCLCTKQVDAIGHCHPNDCKIVVITKASHFKVLLIEKKAVVGSIMNGSNPVNDRIVVNDDSSMLAILHMDSDSV